MKLRINKNKLYIFVVYISLALLLLPLLPASEAPVTLAAVILALAVLIVATYEPLLRVIQQSTGRLTGHDELAYFSAFVELNNKIHKFLQVDDVLILVNRTLKEKIRTRHAVFLLNDCFNTREGKDARALEETREMNSLHPWPEPEARYDFLSEAFIEEVLKRDRVFTSDDTSVTLRKAFEETGTSLAVPIVQNRRLLCLILVGSIDSNRRYSEFEYRMFDYLANQLSIVLDRIRVYEQIMQQTAMDHAEKMQVMQSLSANIAHEMRTPLSGIRASISGIETYLPDLIESYDYARESRPEKVPAIRENHLATLKSTPQRITLMIDQANAVIDMLLMNLRDSSLDERQMSMCSAAHCIEQAVDRYPFKSGEREKLSLELEEDFRFLGVETLFIYIIFNLLKNALYSIRSAQKGDITIRLKRGAEVNHVYFRDTGEGMPEDVREKIFEGFFTTKSDGTGAGLAFCKRTVMSFGGEIECESVTGQYAEFHITLPVLKTS